MTCTTRGSLARASFSMRSSRATFSEAVIESSGSFGAYSEGPLGPLARLLATFTRPDPALPMVRVAPAACISAGRLMSSEYANAVRSPETARTPTPWSMLKLPDLTMPSSRLHASLRVYWK